MEESRQEQSALLTRQANVTAADLTALSASEIAQRIRDRELTAQEVVAAYIQRIEKVNPDLNAVVVPLFQQARAEAIAADAKQARGETLGPLHGVPITIKECFDVKGTPATLGLPHRAQHKATEDSPLVARLRQAGAIVLGKTNVPQLLLYLESDNPLYGRANNPWNRERSPGGSSGGEGAIIAAGGSALGLGNDIGGSLRIPAHFNGINSLKPTSGRLPNADPAGELLLPGQEAIISQAGPMARSVADLSLAMEILAAPGLEKIDPSIAPVVWRDPAAVDVSKLRIGFYTDDGFFTPAPALRRAVREAVATLRERGLSVTEFTPPDVGQAMNLFFGILSCGAAKGSNELLGKGPRDRRVGDLLRLSGLANSVVRRLAKTLRLAGQKRTAHVLANVGTRSTSGYWKLVEERNQYRKKFMTALDAGQYDILICPPNGGPAFTHGASYDLDGVASYTMLYNLLGLPAGVVAATRVRQEEECDRPKSADIVERTARKVEIGSAGLPIGVQVVGRYWREDNVLAVMSVLEQHFRAQADYPARPGE